MFKGLAIESLEKEWKTYPVFHIDFNGADYNKEGELEAVIEHYLSRWEKEYNIVKEPVGLGRRFGNILSEANRQTGLGAVVLIDEYDKPILDVLGTDFMVSFQGQQISIEEYNRNLLKGFYSTFKAADNNLRFVFMTGVTKFSLVSVFSGFNQPDDISMSRQYECLCGITHDELRQYFDGDVRKMVEVYGCTVEEMYDSLKSQYDGYHFSSRMTGVYNPFSLLSALKKSEMQDYWFKTGTPTYLIRLMNHFHEGMDEMTGRYYSADEFSDYKADVERPLPMIYQSGYLTIKKFDRDMNLFQLDFPNIEVKRGFLILIANNYFGVRDNMNSWIQQAVISLRRGEPDKFRTLLTSFLSSIPYSMRRKSDEQEKERYFHYTFYLLLRLISVYTVYTEKQQSQGRVDCIVETKQYVYVFEFKLDGTADEALKQIENKGCAKPYESDSRTVYKIGVSFSSETGTVDDWKQA